MQKLLIAKSRDAPLTIAVLGLKKNNLTSKKRNCNLDFIRVDLSTGVCECSEGSNTGFPCPHLFLLNYKGNLEELHLKDRWLKEKLPVEEGEGFEQDVKQSPMKMIQMLMQKKQ